MQGQGNLSEQEDQTLVGDDVFLDSLDENDMKGNITEILPRRNALIRPASANVDQAMIIFAAAQPAPNLGLLDRFLLMMERQELPTIICFNKQELISGEELDRLCSIYRGSGCKVLTVSVKQQEGLDQIRRYWMAEQRLWQDLPVLASPL